MTEHHFFTCDWEDCGYRTGDDDEVFSVTIGGNSGPEFGSERSHVCPKHREELLNLVVPVSANDSAGETP